MTPQAKRHH